MTTTMLRPNPASVPATTVALNPLQPPYSMYSSMRTDSNPPSQSGFPFDQGDYGSGTASSFRTFNQQSSGNVNYDTSPTGRIPPSVGSGSGSGPLHTRPLPVTINSGNQMLTSAPPAQYDPSFPSSPTQIFANAADTNPPVIGFPTYTTTSSYDSNSQPTIQPQTTTTNSFYVTEAPFNSMYQPVVDRVSTGGTMAPGLIPSSSPTDYVNGSAFGLGGQQGSFSSTNGTRSSLPTSLLTPTANPKILGGETSPRVMKRGRHTKKPSLSFMESDERKVLEHDGPEKEKDKDKQTPSDFIRKLYRMLEPTAGNQAIVIWGAHGDSFVVRDMHSFTTQILPQTFRHSNFSSFVRQLNKYGFAKVKHSEDKTDQYRESSWEFKHPQFYAGGIHELEHIKRKMTANKKHLNNPDEMERERPDTPPGFEEPNNDWASRQPFATDMSSVNASLAAAQEMSLRMYDQVQIMQEELRGLKTEMKIMRSREAAKDEWIPELVMFAVGAAKEIYNLPQSGSFAYSAAQRLIFTYNQLLRRLGSDQQLDVDQVINNFRFNSTSSHSNTDFTPPHLTLPLSEPMVAGPLSMSSDFTPIEPQPDLQPSHSAEGMSTSDGHYSDQHLSGSDSPNNVPGSQGPNEEVLGASNSDGRSVGSGSGTGSGAGSVVSQPTPAAETGVDVAEKKVVKKGKIRPSWMFPPRVLVVEDDVVTQTISTKFLEMIGCATEVVGDAETALNKLTAGEKFDLILMDINLPHISGMNATSIIRRSDLATPIISMTHNPMPDDVKNFFSHGMSDVLPKPFTKHGLFGMLEKHLNHLKTIRRMSSDIPRPVGVPPLSDAGIQDALTQGVLSLSANISPTLIEGFYNPLAGMGCSDSDYMSMLQTYAATGAISANECEQSAPGAALIPPGVSFTMTTAENFAQGPTRALKRPHDEDTQAGLGAQKMRQGKDGPVITEVE